MLYTLISFSIFIHISIVILSSITVDTKLFKCVWLKAKPPYRGKLGKRISTNKFVVKNLAPQNKSIEHFTIKILSSDDDWKRKGHISVAWNYYGSLCDKDGTVIDDSRYYCEPCLKAEQAKLASEKVAHISKIYNISQSTSSGNIKVHLYREHKIDMDNEARIEKNQQLIRNWCVENGSTACSAYDVNLDILLWLSEDLESFNTVDKIGLRIFFHKNCSLDNPDKSRL